MHDMHDDCIEAEFKGNVKRTRYYRCTNTEPQPRRLVRPNKGISAECLTYIVRATHHTEPTSWQDMLQLSSDIKENWIREADEEMKSLKELQIWELIELP